MSIVLMETPKPHTMLPLLLHILFLFQGFPSLAPKSRLRFDVLRLHPFVALYDDEGDFLTLPQAFEARSLNSTKVYEEVVSFIRRNEAIAFLIAEPFDLAGLSRRHNFRWLVLDDDISVFSLCIK